MYLWYFQNLDDLNDKPAIHSFSEVDRKEHLNGFKIGSDASANEFNDKHGSTSTLNPQVYNKMETQNEFKLWK